ncbi:MAG: anti-repressor SinI family protein [Lachnospiraceae bacterium]|nr:anti-repressor SinI family protein [Lachnospiraceae bacterium]
MLEKKKTRNDQEWLDLIQECRTSGLSDREWCQMHSISINTFYNKVTDLRKKACNIPKSQAAPSGREHEVVPIELSCSPAFCPGHSASGALRVPTACAAVTVRMPGYSVEIADGASEETIRYTLLALGRLC